MPSEEAWSAFLTIELEETNVAVEGLSGELFTAIHEALGEASMCWENPGGAGVFDSNHAADVGLRLSQTVGATIARLERERLTFLDTIATLNNECNAWEAALTESRAAAARMRLALEEAQGVAARLRHTDFDDGQGGQLPCRALATDLADDEPRGCGCGVWGIQREIRDALAPDDGWLARREETVRATIVALRKALELSAGGWEDLKALAVEKGTGRVKGLFVSAAKLDEQSAALAITDDRRATEWLARHVEEAVEPYREALLMLSFCPECDEEYPGTANHKPDCRVGLAEEQRHGITRAGRAGTDMEARAALADPAPLEWLRQHDAALLAPYRAFAEFVSRPEAFEDFAEVRRWAKSMMAHADRTAGRAGTEGQP